MAKCTTNLFWKITRQSDIKQHLLLTVCKRFKGNKPKPPRDPPPASSFLKQNRDKDFDPFITSSQFETDSNLGGKWTKIDTRYSELKDDKLQTSPDILNQYSESQILPRTKGIKTLSKFIEEEPYKHRLEPEPEIEIVAEDDNYIFVHKPAGIAVHGSEEYEYDLFHDRKRKNIKTKTFYELFMEHWYKTYPFFRFEPRLLHRLDKNVSGIMVFGKKWCAEEHFVNLLNGNSDYFYGCGIKKCYIAICKGIPNKEQGIIEGRIRKAHWDYRRFAIYNNKKNKDPSNESSQHVKTEYKLIDTCEHGKIGICSLIIFTIHTGKRQQIRATAAALGTPIVGDVLYGGSKYNTLLLHSLFIGFEGIIDTKLLYAVSCLPKWSHLSNHFWSTKAQYHTKQHLDFLMTVPRPSKKPRFLQYSMRKERAGLKRQLESGRSQILLPTEKETIAIDDGKIDKNIEKYNKSVVGIDKSMDKSGLDKMEEFVADNFIGQTIDNHITEMNKARKRIRVYETIDKTKDVYDPLLDGAVPEHFFMDP